MILWELGGLTQGVGWVGVQAAEAFWADNIDESSQVANFDGAVEGWDSTCAKKPFMLYTFILGQHHILLFLDRDMSM